MALKEKKSAGKSNNNSGSNKTTAKTSNTKSKTGYKESNTAKVGYSDTAKTVNPSISTLISNYGKNAPYADNVKTIPTLNKITEINGFDRNIPQIRDYQNANRSRYKNKQTSSGLNSKEKSQIQTKVDEWKSSDIDLEKQENALTAQIAKATSQEERDSLTEQLDSINEQRRTLNKQNDENEKQLFSINQSNIINSLSDDSKKALEDYYKATKGTTKVNKASKLLGGTGAIADISAYLFKNKYKKEAEKALKAQGIDNFDSAYEYYSMARDKEETEKEQQQNAEDYNNSSTVGKILKNAATVPKNLVAGVSTIPELAKAEFGLYENDYAPMNIYSDAFKLRNDVDTVRGEAQENLQKNNGNVAATAYNIGMGIADNVANLPLAGVGKGLSLANMSANVASSSAKDATERGASARQAASTGIASGLIEAATEKIPLDTLFNTAKTAGKAGVAATLKNIAKQSAIEATEESISEAANTIADMAINGSDSAYQQMIQTALDNGATAQEARSQANKYVLGNIGQSALGGAISGGILSGGASAFGKIRNRASNTNVGIDVQGTEDTSVNRQKSAVQTANNAIPVLNKAQNNVTARQTDNSSIDINEALKQAMETPIGNPNQQSSVPTLNTPDVQAQLNAQAQEAYQNMVNKRAETASIGDEMYTALEQVLDQYTNGSDTTALKKRIKTAINKVGKANSKTYESDVEELINAVDEAYKAIPRENYKGRNNPIGEAYRQYESTFYDATNADYQAKDLDKYVKTVKKDMQKYIGMYYPEATAGEKQAFTQSVYDAIDNYVANGNEEALTDINNLLAQADSAMQGRSYTYKKKGKANTLKGARQVARTANYETGDIQNAFNSYLDTLNSKSQNARSRTIAEDSREKFTTSGEVPRLKKNTQVTSDDLWNDLIQGDATQARQSDTYSKGRTDADGNVYKTSQTATNTFRNSDLYEDQRFADMVENDISSGRFDFESVSHEKAYQRAGEALAKDSAGETQRLLNEDWTNGSVDVAKAHLIKEQALENDDMQTLNDMAWKMAQQGHNFAQGLEAFKTFSNRYEITPEGTIQAFYDTAYNRSLQWQKANKREVADINKLTKQMKGVADAYDDVTQIEKAVADIFATKKSTKKLAKDSEVVSSVADMLMQGKSSADILDFLARYESVGINILDEDTKEFVMQQVSEAEQLGDSKERAEIMDKVYAQLANKIANTSIFDKINSYRYMCMLSSPTTHIANIAGNTTNYLLRRTSRDIQAVMESIVSTDQRTTSILNPFNAKDRELLQRCKDYVENDAYSTFKGNTKFNVNAGIESNKRVFKTGLLEKARNLEQNALDVEDWIFVRKNGAEYLASYIKANGADANIFTEKGADVASNETVEKFLQEAVGYAAQRAKEATYHESSKLASFMSNWRKTAENGGIGSKLAYTAANTTLPFASMSENYLKEGMRYSPLQVGKAIGEIAIPKLRNGMTTSDLLEDMAQGLTGTAAMALGTALATCGIINGSGDSDEEQREFDELQGKQGYSLNLSLNGKNYTYTIDGILGSGGMSILAGANIAESMKDEGFSITDITNAMSQLANPFIEQSFISGFEDVLSQIRYASEGDELSTAASAVGANYASQFIPTVLRRTANAVNGESKTSYTGMDRENVLGNMAAKIGYKTINSIPALGKVANNVGATLSESDNSFAQRAGSYLQNANQPYLNAWGERKEVPGNNLAERLGYQLGSKGFLEEYNTSDIEAALQDVNDNAQNDVSVFPTTPSSSVTVNGEKRKLQPTEYTEYQERVGANEKEILSSYIQSDFYKNGDADSQAEVIGTIYNFSKALATYDMFDNELKGTNEKLYNLYQRYGGEGVVAYFNANYLSENDNDNKSKTGEDRSLSSSSAARQYQYLLQSNMSESQAADYIYETGATSDKEAELYNEYGADNLGKYYEFRSALGTGDDKASSSTAIYTLKNYNGLTDEEKGAFYRTAYSVQLEKDGKLTKAGKVYSTLGDGGLYRYYVYKNEADLDGNGSLKKSEISTYLSTQDLSAEDRAYWSEVLKNK